MHFTPNAKWNTKFSMLSNDSSLTNLNLLSSQNKLNLSGKQKKTHNKQSSVIISHCIKGFWIKDQSETSNIV